MLGRVVLLLLVPAFAGCAIPGADLLGGGVPGASQWTWDLEDSMLPDFSGDGPSYPVLAVHHHEGVSERTRQEWERNPVVCLADEGVPLPSFPLGNADAAAPCHPPVADPATGRLFVPRDTFDSWDARAVVVFPSNCGGSAHPVGADGVFRLRSLEHEFRVVLRDDGAFVIDGEHVVPPGKTLKATYWTDYGDEMDQRFVRVVFDNPGEWLESQVVGERGRQAYTLDVRPTQASLDGQDRVLEAWLPAAPGDLGDLLTPLVHATEGSDATVKRLGFTLADGRLTEVDVAVRTEEGVTRWYLASRHGDQVRVLGNRSDHAPAGAEPFALRDAFPDSLETYLGDGVAHRFAWRPDAAYHDPLPGGVDGDPTDCDDCVFLWSDALDWYRPLVVQGSDADDARTLVVESHAADGSTTTRSYHRP